MNLRMTPLRENAKWPNVNGQWLHRKTHKAKQRQENFDRAKSLGEHTKKLLNKRGENQRRTILMTLRG